VRNERSARIRNTKNKIFATPVASAAIPPNPNTAAIIATTKNVSAQFNIYPPDTRLSESVN
jgi:hypothetical protein